MTASNALIRSKQRFIVTVLSLILNPVFMLGPATLGVGNAVVSIIKSLGAIHNTLSFLLVLPAMVGVSVFIAKHMLENYHWVELDDEVIRGRRFWTRKFVERRIDEISEIVPLEVVGGKFWLHTRWLGSIVGYEIRFNDGGPSIGLLRYDMTNVDILIEKLSQLREHHAENEAT